MTYRKFQYLRDVIVGNITFMLLFAVFGMFYLPYVAVNILRINCSFLLLLLLLLDARVRSQCQQIRSDLWAACDAKEENETNAYRFQPEVSHRHSRRWQVYPYWAIPT